MNEPSQQINHYFDCWRLAYREIMGRPERHADDLANKWSQVMKNPDDWFYHETPAHYFVLELAPELVSHLSPQDQLRFHGLLQKALEMGDSNFYSKPDYDWKDAKKRVKEVFRNHGLGWPYG